MTTKIKSTVVRKAITSAMESLDLKIERGSFKFDASTNSLTLVIASNVKETKPATPASSGDVERDKFLAVVEKQGLDKKVRRWFGRTIIDTDQNKFEISAISNNGEKFTLTPKDGEGRNKRMEFSAIETYIDLGRKARLDIKGKTAYIPDGKPTATTSNDTKPNEKSLEVVDSALALPKLQLNKLIEVLDNKGIIEKPSRNTKNLVKKALLGATKITGRQSVESFLARISKESSVVESGADLTPEQIEDLNSRFKSSFRKERNAARKSWEQDLPAKAKFMAKILTSNGVRFLVGFNVSREAYRGFDPESGRIKTISATRGKVSFI